MTNAMTDARTLRQPILSFHNVVKTLGALGALIAVIFLSPCAAAQEGKPQGGLAELPAEVAAMHPKGKWKIKNSELYRYLVKYYGKHPHAIAVLDDYIKVHFVEMEGHRRKIVVTDADVSKWIAALDAKVRAATGGRTGIKEEVEKKGMNKTAFRRRAHSAILRQRIASQDLRKRDPTRPKGKELQEADVQLVIDRLFQESERIVDPKRLPAGVVAILDGKKLTEYEFGRELAQSLALRMITQALEQLIDTKEVAMLVGEGEPTPEEMREQRNWWLDYQRRQLRRRVKDPRHVNDDTLKMWLARMGLSPQMIFESAPFRAEARGRGHFRSKTSAEDLVAYYEANKGKFGHRVQVQRIFVRARAQRQLPVGGRPVPSLAQGKARAQAIHIRVTHGEDFASVARKESDDLPEIKARGGVLSLWIYEGLVGYQEIYQHASKLKVNEISRPFFDRRGFSLVKLLRRDEAESFEEIKDKVRASAGDDAYHIWRFQARRNVLRNKSLFLDR